MKHAWNRCLICSLSVAFITLRNLFGTLFSPGALSCAGFYIVLRISKSVSSAESSIGTGYFARPVSILARGGGGKKVLRRQFTFSWKVVATTSSLVFSDGNFGSSFGSVLLFFPYAAMLQSPFDLVDALWSASLK